MTYGGAPSGLYPFAAFGLGALPATTASLVSHPTIAFDGSPSLSISARMTASAAIRFGGQGYVQGLGKPVVVRAMPQSWTVYADPADFTLQAVYGNFTVRAKP